MPLKAIHLSHNSHFTLPVKSCLDLRVLCLSQFRIIRHLSRGLHKSSAVPLAYNLTHLKPDYCASEDGIHLNHVQTSPKVHLDFFTHLDFLTAYREKYMLAINLILDQMLKTGPMNYVLKVRFLCIDCKEGIQRPLIFKCL